MTERFRNMHPSVNALIESSLALRFLQIEVNEEDIIVADPQGAVPYRYLTIVELQN